MSRLEKLIENSERQHAANLDAMNVLQDVQTQMTELRRKCEAQSEEIRVITERGANQKDENARLRRMNDIQKAIIERQLAVLWAARIEGIWISDQLLNSHK